MSPASPLKRDKGRGARPTADTVRGQAHRDNVHVHVHTHFTYSTVLWASRSLRFGLPPWRATTLDGAVCPEYVSDLSLTHTQSRGVHAHTHTVLWASLRSGRAVVLESDQRRPLSYLIVLGKDAATVWVVKNAHTCCANSTGSCKIMPWWVPEIVCT